MGGSNESQNALFVAFVNLLELSHSRGELLKFDHLTFQSCQVKGKVTTVSQKVLYQACALTLVYDISG